MQHDNVPFTVLLCREAGGQATAIARVTDPDVVARVRDAIVIAKQAEARSAQDPFSRRRAELEAALIQEAHA